MTPAKDDARPLIIPVFLPHAGCPHQCVFCNQKAATGATHGPEPTPDHVRQEALRYLGFSKKTRLPVLVSFYGGNFLNISEKSIRGFLDAAQSLVDEKKIHGIRFSTRPDTIDEKSLNLISAYQVTALELGAQSMDDRVLEISKRGHNAAQTKRATDLLKKNGYQVGLHLMAGLPGDTKKGAIESAKKVRDLGPDWVRVHPKSVPRRRGMNSEKQ